MEKIRNLCISAYVKAKALKKHICEDEMGASDMIAVVVLVAIVVVLGVAFREKLVELISSIWGDVDEQAGKVSEEITIGGK